MKTQNIYKIAPLMLFPFLLCCKPSDNANSNVDKEAGVVAQNEEKDTENQSARPEEWSYKGNRSPKNWGELSPAYALCGSGKSQSPINIIIQGESSPHSWKFEYKTTDLHIAHNEHMEEIIDNGHTIQVTTDKGSHFVFNDVAYELKQFHFHTPSEHTIDGKNLPMEAHFVHQSPDGKLAVVSALFKIGETKNPTLTALIENLPKKKGDVLHPENEVLNLGDHIPSHENAYAYSGSLTTPPCSEDVQWLILGEMVEATLEQIEAFSSVIGPNNRPVQKLNEREIETIQTDLLDK